MNILLTCEICGKLMESSYFFIDCAVDPPKRYEICHECRAEIKLRGKNYASYLP